MQKGYLHIRIN